jgi:hypothetical protein
MTAALDGDKASAEALAKKGNLLSGEKALAAVANFGIAERIVVLQSCELAQAMKLPSQIGSAIRPKILNTEISKLCNAQKEVLARGPIKVPHNALVINSASKVMEAFNTSLSNVANNPAMNQSEVGNLNVAIGNVISQTAAVNNSEMLNKKPPKKEK